MYLLDTNVVSAARRRDPTAATWLASVRGRPLFISVLTIGEIRRGIVKARTVDRNAAHHLERWLDRTVADFAGSILPIDQDIARVWGDLSAARSLPVADALIAATALHHGLAVVTRNIRNFRGAGIALVDPWGAA